MAKSNISDTTKQTSSTFFYKLIGLGASGYPYFEGPNFKDEYPWDRVFSEDMRQIGDFFIYYYIGRDFIFNQQLQCFICTISYYPAKDLYYKESNYTVRIPFRQTKFPQHADFSDNFVSNIYFCTKESAILLGHFEFLIRTQLNSCLLEKLLPKKPMLPFRNHFRNLFEYLLGTSEEDKAKRASLLSQYTKYRLEKPSSIQKLADAFSVGICVISIKSENKYKKYTFLPELPEINPIPLIKLITYGNYTCVLYSNAQNEFDGFDENGVIVKSYQNETLPETFYCAEKSLSYNPLLLEIIDKLVLCIKPDNDKKTNDLINEIVGKIESDEEFSTNMMKTVKILKDKMISAKQKSQPKQVDKVEDNNIKSSIPQATGFNKNHMVTTQNKTSNDRPQNRFANNFLPASERMVNIPDMSHRSKSPMILPTSKMSDIQCQIYNANALMRRPIDNQKEYTKPSVSSQPDKNYNEELKIKSENVKAFIMENTLANPLLKRNICGGCEKVKKCENIHSNCSMCQDCMLQCIEINVKKCFICTKTLEERVVKQVCARKEWTCDNCGKNGRIKRMSCRCFLCEVSCLNKPHICS